MAYAEVSDIQNRMTRNLSQTEESVCGTLLEDVAILIDSINRSASAEVKQIVSCRAVIRALGDSDSGGVPVGATQGSKSALGYSESWTFGNGSSGEIYLSKTEKQLLGADNCIGSYSPIQELVPNVEN